ncbi:MAG TPA: hypothetical protein VH593_28875 [Ktedonobacteraceae bacterium]|jgi:hypothetical protein
MSHTSSDRYIYFTVGLLKDSFTLEELRQDAMKHHMIEQPGQLIALRLTEYYEMMTKGVVQPVVRVPAIIQSVETEGSNNNNKDKRAGYTSSHASPQPSQQTGSMSPFKQVTNRMRALRRDQDNIISASPDADRNADEAADYWNTL